MKSCGKCKQELSIDNFAKNKARYDGLQGYCRKCDKEKGSQYAKNNRSSALQRTQKWQKNNRDKHLEGLRTNRIKHKEAGTLKKYPVNKEAHRLRMIERRARTRKNGVFMLLPKEEKRLISGPCFYCGSPDRITIDHIIPIDKGGRHSVGNLVSACKSCNSSKGAKFLVVWRLRKMKGK